MNRILILTLSAIIFLGNNALGLAAPLEWNQLPLIPNQFGLGGPNVGVHNGALIVAGGANFPNGPPWQVTDKPKGNKVWHKKVFVLEKGETSWHKASPLPKSLAYAATVSVAEGVYLLGGESYGDVKDAASGKTTPTNHPVADVLLVSWNQTTKKLKITENALPPLPRPCQYHRAAVIDRVIYVTASHTASPQSRQLDVISFWALDLKQRPGQRRWKSLAPWPGPAREKMALAVQHATVDGKSTPCLFMISGATWTKDVQGEMDLTKFEFFTDAYRYHPASNRWQAIAGLPVLKDKRKINLSQYEFNPDKKTWSPLKPGQQTKHDINQLFAGQPMPLAASTAIAAGSSHVLLFSGATGRYITMNLSECPTFPRYVMSYNTSSNRWSSVGQMPEAVVTTKAVRWGNMIVVPSGEIRPGIRTRQVQGLPLDSVITTLKR